MITLGLTFDGQAELKGSFGSSTLREHLVGAIDWCSMTDELSRLGSKAAHGHFVLM